MRHPLPTALFALGTLLVGTTQAATIFTPPLVPGGNNLLDCYLVNVSDEPRNATIVAVDRDGNTVKSVDVRLDPGAEAVAQATASENARYCRFEVDGKKTHFRASILVVQDGVGSVSALAGQ